MSKAGEAVLVPVLPNHRFDEASLRRYLAGKLPGAGPDLVIRQFQGGQSNPTFYLEAGGRAYVLRKKPPGTLLPSAHAVDREFAVMKALADTKVPVPKVHLLCTDESVIGQIFYVMDYVPGRVFTDKLLPGCSSAERAAMYDHMNEVLAALHTVDYRAVGLEGFGKPQQYIARQISRWSKQYVGSRPDDVPEMDKLMAWLPEHVPAEDETSIVHGDYRPGNLLFHPTEPRVVAVLDWELATIGHPLADLAYNCLAYHMVDASGRGFGEVDFASLGIPEEDEYVAAYCRRTGRSGIPDWKFFIVFSMFRSAAIIAGVYRRGLDGNASDPRALEMGETYKEIARHAWSIAQTIRPRG